MTTTSLSASLGRLGKSLEDFKRGAAPLVVAHNKLVPYRRQARTHFDPVALTELAASIKEMGILVPPLVRPLGDGRFEILAGERRWRASGMAGLSEITVLVKTVNDDAAEKIHLHENIQRENLSSMELAQRVQEDLDLAKGDLGKVAAKYGKEKPWVSKLSSIARGGQVTTALIDNSITSDRAVLSTVSSLERKDAKAAKALGEALAAAPQKADKRKIASEFAKALKKNAVVLKGTDSSGVKRNDAWRGKTNVERVLSQPSVAVEISPHSLYATEFKEMFLRHGSARLSMEVKHGDAQYAVVEFGVSGLNRRSYQASELRLLSVA